MSILHDEGQQAIATESRRVVDSLRNPELLLALLETTGEHDERFWSAAVEQGWTAIAVPEECGGLGLGLTEVGLIAASAGTGPAGAPFLVPGYGVTVGLIASNDAASAASGASGRWLPLLASGEAKGAVALAEGTAPLPAQPAVTLRDGKLNGTKPAVPAGLGAEIALVWAAGEDGPVLALCELKDAVRNGVSSFDNSRLHADLVFTDTPAVELASGEAARALALDVVARMAVATAWEQMGGAEALLYTARDYALTRKAFGQPIGGFQSVKHRIAELYGLVEIARANCIHAAAREGQADFLAAACAARLSATEAYDTAARDTVQIHGGIGVTWEGGLHLHMRRARSLAIEGGNMMFWEDLLVNELAGADR